MAVTQKQIAEALGLSRSLVGEALSGHPRVSTETRERVMGMARQMGYDVRSNEAARSLIARRYGQRRRTRVLGLVLGSSNPSDNSLGSQIFQGIHAEGRLHDYDLLVVGQLMQYAAESLPGMVNDTRIDGLILVNFLGLESVLHKMAEAEMPIVTCLSNENPPNVPSIMMDNYDGMRQAVRHLVDRGHRNIVHFAGERLHSDGRERAEGFVRAMAEVGLPCGEERVFEGGWGQQINPVSLRGLFDLKATAVICSNDPGAEQLWSELEARGRMVPNHISIIGCDDLPGYGEKLLTTLNVPWTEIGRHAVRSLLSLLAGESPETLSHRLPVRLVERESVATLSTT